MNNTIENRLIDETARRFGILGKTVPILKPEHGPTEVVWEICPSRHTGSLGSMALALVGNSKPHYHRRIREVYFVEQGSLDLWTIGRSGDRCVHHMKKGDHHIISSYTLHWAVALKDPAAALVFAAPAWDEDDHLMASPEQFLAVIVKRN